MNELKIFNNDEFGSIRTLRKGNEVWFVGNDVADILEYQNGSRDINRHVDKEDRTIEMINDGYQNRKTIIINESGLYALVFGSKMDRARKFKRWVTNDILPSIRKTGGYIKKPHSIEDLIIMQAQSMKQLKEQVQKQGQQIQEVKQSFAEIKDNWREYVNRVFAKIGQATGDYEGFRKESYILLNRRARCDLDQRLKNRIQRMKRNGSTKTAIRNTNKLDIIEEEPRLKEIYIKIVQEMETKYL